MVFLNTILMVIAIGAIIFSIIRVGITPVNVLSVVLFIIAVAVNLYTTYRKREHIKQQKQRDAERLAMEQELAQRVEERKQPNAEQ